MNDREVRGMHHAVSRGDPIGPDLAVALLRAGKGEVPGIVAAASAVRQRFFGLSVHLCSILNAKSGRCEQDCSFCAQAACHDSEAEFFPLVSTEEMVRAFREAAALPLGHFSVVTSGGKLSGKCVSRICDAVAAKPAANAADTAWCASLGCLDEDSLRALKQAGLSRYHHNLEAAESFFPQICTTHGYSGRLATIRAAREAGLEVCSGGILGMGESLEQRVELAAALAEESVESIALNFLLPLPGTALEGLEPMEPLDIVKSIAVFRLMNPGAEIRICAGRALLRDFQSWIFYAGATGMMVGPLLTTPGREPEDDFKMIEDLGLLIEKRKCHA